MRQKMVRTGVFVLFVGIALVSGVFLNVDFGGTVAVADAAASDDWRPLGKQVFEQSCAACHGMQGEGIPGVFPPHAGNEFVLGDPIEPMRVIIYGRSGMPSFGDNLTDEQLAAVLNYMRTSWGNDASVVTTEFAAMVRAEHGDEGQIEEVTN